MMNDLTWSAIRADTIDRFHGQTPRPDDEAAIIDVFELHPQLVLRAIDETAAALDAGKITWAWSVVKSRLERGTTAIREATADTTQSKLKRIENAKRWIANAGIHYDLERDIMEELFGERGRLKDIQLTDPQRDEFLDHWRTLRPRGEQIEAHLEERLRPKELVKTRTAPVTWPAKGEPCTDHTTPVPKDHAGESETESHALSGTTAGTASASDPDADIPF